MLWLKGRAIVRAFEVEHTTAVYSGILRMADLLALQPNMDIKLHIVAPETRKAKVMGEIQRPVFSLLEKGPLSEYCTFLPYGSLQEEVFDYAPFRLHVVSRPADQEGWVKLPQRWVVERTFAWLGRSRRLSKDYEREPASSEAMVKVSMIHRMLRRLHPTATKISQRFR